MSAHCPDCLNTNIVVIRQTSETIRINGWNGDQTPRLGDMRQRDVKELYHCPKCMLDFEYPSFDEEEEEEASDEIELFEKICFNIRILAEEIDDYLPRNFDGLHRDSAQDMVELYALMLSLNDVHRRASNYLFRILH